MRASCVLMVATCLLLACGFPKAKDEPAPTKEEVPAKPDARGANAELKLDDLIQWRDDFNTQMVATYGNKAAARKVREEKDAYIESIRGKTVAGFAVLKRIRFDNDKTAQIHLGRRLDPDSGINLTVLPENAACLAGLKEGDDVFAQGTFTKGDTFSIVGMMEKK